MLSCQLLWNDEIRCEMKERKNRITADAVLVTHKLRRVPVSLPVSSRVFHALVWSNYHLLEFFRSSLWAKRPHTWACPFGKLGGSCLFDRKRWVWASIESLWDGRCKLACPQAEQPKDRQEAGLCRKRGEEMELFVLALTDLAATSFAC